MLDPTVALWIRRLLQEGLSRSEVARITGVWRGWISLIARGIGPDDATLREQMERDCRRPDRPARRCPACGVLVGRLCDACWACWASASANRRPPGAGPVDGFQNPLRQARSEKPGQRYRGPPATPRWPDRGLSGRHDDEPL